MASEHPGKDKHDPFHIVIVGAGLAGCLCGVLLGGISDVRPVRVTILEYRSDPRRSGNSVKGRSINLALSARGLAALARIGLDGEIRKIAVPMHGRFVHDPLGRTSLQRYGQKGQYLLSVSRAELNRLLLENCDSRSNVSVLFNAKCIDIDLEHSRVVYMDQSVLRTVSDAQPTRERWIHADLIVGADGTYSRVRAAMERFVPRFDYSREHIPALYKELSMPKQDHDTMPREWLHVWPRKSFMLIALPNTDGSFTSTLFMSSEKFEQLHSDGGHSVSRFFAHEFPDAVPLIPHLEDQFSQSPTCPLMTVRCSPYHFKDSAVLVGDAAHAIVPFYGQGCNAAFEGCVQLANEVSYWRLERLSDALHSYSAKRKPNADAIAELAVEHYNDMASKSASIAFALRRRLEIFLHRVMPSKFVPLYTMVTFTTIPYADAVDRAERQDTIIKYGLSLVIIACVIASAIAYSAR